MTKTKNNNHFPISIQQKKQLHMLNQVIIPLLCKYEHMIKLYVENGISSFSYLSHGRAGKMEDHVCINTLFFVDGGYP